MRYAAVVYVASIPSKRKAGIKNLLVRLWQDENGQELVEYSFLMVSAPLAVTVGMNTIATAINTIFTVPEIKLTAS